MPAATPQEAATKWEQNTQSGVAKYRAKLQQMYQNYAAALQAQPLGPEVRLRAIENYARSLMRFGG